MRVSVTGLRGVPGIMGGVESHCENLLPRIKRLAPELDIEVLGRAPYMRAGLREFCGVRLTPIPSPKRQNREAIFSTFRGVLQARREGTSLLHIHAIGPGLLTPLARMLGLKVIVTHHGRDYNRAKWGIVAKAMLRLGEILAIYFANATIVVAPSLAEDLRKRFPARASRIHYIPNGCHEFSGEVDDRAVLKRFALKPKSYFLAVARLVPEKGLDVLIDGFERSESNKELIIAGGADHETDYSRKLRARATDRVKFVGMQPREVLEALYRNAALFVLPSFHEGLPISALEAGTLGTPILLSAIQPSLDLGLPPINYFPSGDSDALAAKLQLDSGHYAVDRSLFASFDWGDISQRTLSVYRSVLQQRVEARDGRGAKEATKMTR